jgi:hypothetical protein
MHVEGEGCVSSIIFQFPSFSSGSLLKRREPSFQITSDRHLHDTQNAMNDLNRHGPTHSRKIALALAHNNPYNLQKSILDFSGHVCPLQFMQESEWRICHKYLKTSIPYKPFSDSDLLIKVAGAGNYDSDNVLLQMVCSCFYHCV